MQRPNPKDFITPRATYELADTITLHRHLLFIEPAALPYIASALISGAPILAATGMSLHANVAARLINAQWRDPMAPKLQTPPPHWFSDMEFSRVRGIVSTSQGGVLDFVYFSGHGSSSFPRHAACTLHLDPDAAGTIAVQYGPNIAYSHSICLGRNPSISTTTKRIPPSYYSDPTDYIFSTDATPPEDTRTTNRHISNDAATVNIPAVVGEENITLLSGVPLAEKSWGMHYVEPGTDLALDMACPEGIAGTYALHRAE